jgi:hypothetical protein
MMDGWKTKGGLDDRTLTFVRCVFSLSRQPEHPTKNIQKSEKNRWRLEEQPHPPSIRAR